MEQLAVLRASAQRLTTTPVEELPRIAHFLASSVSSCENALRVSPNKSSENTVPVHKLKTRLSSLLHDKTVSGRFTAAVIIKAYVETASANGAEWETWLRTLIGCLSKPDPWQVKKVYLSTIVRILLLCQQSPQLQREVSTPHLPAFITSTLAIIRPASQQSGTSIKTTSSPLLPCVFRCWLELLQHYGNTIRPFVNRIRPICLSVLSERGYASSLQDLAAQVLASLLRCSPKNVLQGEWDSSFKSIIKSTHQTLDLVFRSIHEDWLPAEFAHSRPSVSHNYSRSPRTETHDSAGLLPWKGIHEGTLRVVNLLRWLENMLHCSAQPATIPIGELVLLLNRTLSVIIPEISSIAQYPLRFHDEVGKEEKEELWSNLPKLHAASLGFSKALILMFGQAVLSTSSTVANQVLDLFVAEKWHAGIRQQSYQFWTSLLQTSPLACTQVNRQNFNDLCMSCCSDLAVLIHQTDQKHQVNGSALNATVTASSKGLQNSVSSLDSSRHGHRHYSGLHRAAQELLVTVLDQAPVTVLSTPARTEMDRTAILLNDEHAMYASVLNPPAIRPGQRPTPSLIPFLVQISEGGDNKAMAVEALIRPRMPLILAPTVPTVVEEEHEETADDENMPEAVPPSNASSNWHPHPHTSHTVLGESSVVTKRDFATMQGITTSIAASRGEEDRHQEQLQPEQQVEREDPLFKKAKNVIIDKPVATASATATPAAATATSAELVTEQAADTTYLFKSTEGIKIYSNPATIATAATTATSSSSGIGGTAAPTIQSAVSGPSLTTTHGNDEDDDDDSDGSEIPALDMAMVIDYEEEDDEEEEEDEVEQ